MWLYTAKGFFSIVEDMRSPKHVFVRARVRDDLKRFLPKKRIISTPERDYPFRCRLTKIEFATRLMDAAYEITYPNFKSEVLRVDGHQRLSVYHDVHAVTCRLNPVEDTAGEVIDLTRRCSGYGAMHAIGECACFR